MSKVNHKKASDRKSRAEVRKAIKALDAIDPGWRKHEAQMNEAAKTIQGNGEPVDVFLFRLYKVAREMAKPLVEIAHA